MPHKQHRKILNLMTLTKRRLVTFFVAPTFIGAYSSLITQMPNKLAQQVNITSFLGITAYTIISN